jgi:predicted DNA-binding antitoxin AbrB/MazE fold protein
MIQKLAAIYENGLLRPLHNLNLPEKSEVNLVIESNPPLTPPSKRGEIGSAHPLWQFAGILSDGEAEDIENIIHQELRTVNNDEW